MINEKECMLVFVGSYAEETGPSVYVYAFNDKSETLSLLSEVSGLKNPTFLNVDEHRQILYTIGEQTLTSEERQGEVAAYAIDPTSGTLTEKGRALSSPTPTCHIARDLTDQYLVVASYNGGSVSLVSLTEAGMPGVLLDTVQHTGSSVNPERQREPHPHSALFSPDGKFVFVPDLGLDSIRTYQIDVDKQKLHYHSSVEIHPGAGPRHMVFHPNGRYAYVINELDSTVTVLQYDAEQGLLQDAATYTTLPEDYKGESACAEVTISQDGKFLYGSNRGHDSIVVYAVEESSGSLELVQHVSTEGQHPRHFALTPGGKHMIVANRDTDNMTIYRINPSTGELTYTGHSISVSKPVCVKPVMM